jgi:hypothetical protein
VAGAVARIGPPAPGTIDGSGVTAAPPAGTRRSPLFDGRLALLAGLMLLVILAIGLTPTIFREQTRDWIAYDQAAHRLVAGEPLYVFALATPDDEYYLYPPPMAAIWSAVGSPEALLVLKILALASVAALAFVVAPRASVRERAPIAIALAVAALLAPPDVHDLVLGNVMALYIGAVAVSLARPGWIGAIPLGLVCAVALKPVIGPYLVWLAIRRRGDAGRVVAAGLAASAIVAVFVGPGRYVEYLIALPQMSVLVDLPTGNVGLSALSREIAIVGLMLAYGATAWAALRLDLHHAAAVAIAAGLLAQPSIGFNYAGLLLPAVVMLWSGDRVAGLVACLLVPLVTVVSPPLAAGVVIVLAFARIEARLPAGRRSPAPEAAS